MLQSINTKQSISNAGIRAPLAPSAPSAPSSPLGCVYDGMVDAVATVRYSLPTGKKSIPSVFRKWNVCGNKYNAKSQFLDVIVPMKFISDDILLQ